MPERSDREAMKVAILDAHVSSGAITQNFPDVQVTNLLVDGTVNPFKQVNYPHGTVCSMVYLSISKQLDLLCISMLDALDATAFSHAIDVCMSNNVDVVLCCFGTTSAQIIPLLLAPLSKLKDDHIQIVAACSNDNVVTFPASLPSVLGVRSLGIGNDYYFTEKVLDGIELSMYVPKVDIIETLNHNFHCGIPYSNSIAAAYATSLYAAAQSNKAKTIKLHDYFHTGSKGPLPYMMYESLERKPEIPTVTIMTDCDTLAEYVQCDILLHGYIALLLSNRKPSMLEKLAVGIRDTLKYFRLIPQLFDVDFIVAAPNSALSRGIQWDIVICADGDSYCLEFSDESPKTGIPKEALVEKVLEYFACE